MNRSLISLTLMASLTSPSFAQDFARLEAADRAQAQLSVCEAFYRIEADCAKNQDLLERLSTIEKRSKAAAGIARLGEAAAALRLELNLVKQRSLIGERCEDVATLQRRYDVECAPLSAP